MSATESNLQQHGEQVPPELIERLKKIEEKQNQGEEFGKEDYRTLYIIGLIIPVLLMIAGWYL